MSLSYGLLSSEYEKTVKHDNRQICKLSGVAEAVKIKI